MTNNNSLEGSVGAELDRVTAEQVMCWYPVKSDCGNLMWSTQPEATTTNLDVIHDNDPPWSPSTNITDAMEVVERMRERGYRFRSHYSEWTDGTWRWEAEFEPSNHAKDGSHYGVLLSESICHAAIAALRATGESGEGNND